MAQLQPLRSAANQQWCALAAVTVALVLLALTRPAATACTSGVIQLVPPASLPEYDGCFRPAIDQNTLKTICGAAFKVTVTKGIIRAVPIEEGTFTYGNTPVLGGGSQLNSFNCKNLNASGLFNSGSTSAATLMLYDNLGGPLSNFTKTGPNQVSLTVGHTYSFQGPPLSCTYTYSVVSGCVLDAKPASSTPPPCRPGHISKTGRFGIKYCSPCPQGTYSPGGSATSCLLCPVGTANNLLGMAKCKTCAATELLYGPKPGLTFCVYCNQLSNNVWTDGKTKCGDCPAGSTPSRTKPWQCVRCYAGKKCCTVNWDKNCPKCTSDAKPKTYTSIFALESATSAACLASDTALCSPKINITIDGTCTISIDNLENGNTLFPFTPCSWTNTLPIRGAAAKAAVDLAWLAYPNAEYNSPLLNANVTSAASPYLSIRLPAQKCALRYRALTSPAAKILGAAPKPNPAPASSCPAGKYIDTTTDTKPGPCLPCPPGYYSTKPGSKGTCTACPAGSYAGKYGSTRCTKCPRGRVAQRGAAACIFCNVNQDTYPSKDASTCLPCPKDTISHFGATGVCLGNVLGNTCCAAGLCTARQTCGRSLTPLTGGTAGFQSIFRLKSRSLSSPSCRRPNLISCLPDGARISISTQYQLSFYLETTTATTCATNSSWAIASYYGDVAGTNRALISAFEEPAADVMNYDLLTDPAARTLTVYFSFKGNLYQPKDIIPSPTIRKECSATFKLLTGYFLDLQQPASTTCPASTVTVKTKGRTLCQYCGRGSFKNAKGACQPCPAGTYQPLFDGTICKPCSAGYNCFQGSSKPEPCSRGQYAPKPRSKACSLCPPGTYTSYGANKACTKCPKGTIAPAPESKGCGVPWATRF